MGADTRELIIPIVYRLLRCDPVIDIPVLYKVTAGFQQVIKNYNNGGAATCPALRSALLYNNIVAGEMFNTQVSKEYLQQVFEKSEIQAK